MFWCWWERGAVHAPDQPSPGPVPRRLVHQRLPWKSRRRLRTSSLSPRCRGASSPGLTISASAPQRKRAGSLRGMGVGEGFAPVCPKRGGPPILAVVNRLGLVCRGAPPGGEPKPPFHPRDRLPCLSRPPARETAGSNASGGEIAARELAEPAKSAFLPHVPFQAPLLSSQILLWLKRGRKEGGSRTARAAPRPQRWMPAGPGTH